MASSRFKAALFLFTFAVNEVAVVAMRVKARDGLQKVQGTSNSSKTEDLDWGGCAALWCSKTGCARHYVWLDGPMQSCRYTDAYKLQDDQIATFFPVEMDRLVEKTATFAKKGCLTGGWWFKCYRRMQQILRLFNYVRKAQGIVFAAGEDHPAYSIMNDPETQKQFSSISENIAEGFSKNKETGKLCVKEGIKKMTEIPGEVLKMEKEAAERGVPLTDKEKATIEQSKQVVALLAINCQEVTDEEADQVRAQMEASGQGETIAPSAEKDELDSIVEEQEDTIMMMKDSDREAIRGAAEETDEDEEDEVDPDEHDELQYPELPEPSLISLSDTEKVSGGNSSLVQLASGDGPLKILVKGGWNGLSWLVSHGVGWIFRRLVWTLAFMVGFTFSLVRAVVVWPILLLFCGSARSISWLFKDVLWDGKNIKKGFNAIGHCAPDMWNAVGFSTTDPGHSAASQTILAPARDASWLSGVYHPWKEGKPDPCRRIQCGREASCKVANNYLEDFDKADTKCYCNYGTYPVYDASGQQTGDCGLQQSKHGCTCQKYWSSWGVGYYGCNQESECRVTPGCSADLNKTSDILARGAKWVLGIKKTIDKCTYQRGPIEVAIKSVDTTINSWGKKIDK